MGRSAASLASAVFCVVGMVLFAALSLPSPVLAADVAVAEVGFIDWLLANVPDVLQAASLLIGAASAVAALTPTPKDDGVLLWLRKAVDFLALNVGGAKNVKSAKDSWSVR